jgi:hypothetical protein
MFDISFKNMLTGCITTIILMVIFSGCISSCNTTNAKLLGFCLEGGHTPNDCKLLTIQK